MIKVFFKIFSFFCIRLLYVFRKTFFSYGCFDQDKVQSVLIVELALLGDVVAIEPLVTRVKENLPNAQVSVITRFINKAILEDHPAISNIYTITGKGIKHIFKFLAENKELNFDLVISAGPGLYNSLFSLLVGKKFVSGYLNNNSFKTYYYQDHVVQGVGFSKKSVYLKNEHITVRALKSTIPCGFENSFGENSGVRPMLYIAQDRENSIFQLLLDKGFIDYKDKHIVVHPGASVKYRQWPVERFGQLFQKLVEYDGQVRIIIIGIPSEKELHKSIIKISPKNVISYISTDLFESMVLIKHCKLFIGSDSGPKHMANGFSCPIIEILGPQLPDTIGAVGDNVVSLYKQLDCNPCSQQKCINDGMCNKAISVEEVYSAAKNLLSKPIS